jgi:hypothetical protein
MTVFVAHGLLFASWTAHIPDVKAHLGLTDGTLGFALLGAPVGSVTAMIASSWLLPRVGSRRVVQVALVGYCAAGPLAGLTGSLPALFGALFAWGAFQGTLDVAMNTQAIAVERTQRRVLMSGLHGSWSIGALAGAGIGALAGAAGITLTIQLLVLGTIALLVAGLLTTRMLPPAAEHPGESNAPAGLAEAGQHSSRPSSRWSGGMVLLGAIAFASMLCEGATADWSAVYPVRPAARQRRGPRPGLHRVRPGHGHRPAIGQPVADPLPARPAAARARRGRDARIHRSPAHRPAARSPPRLRLPRHRTSFRRPGRVQRGRADTRAGSGHCRGHRISLRMGRVRLRPARHRAPVCLGVPAGCAGPAAPADCVRRHRHPQITRAARTPARSAGQVPGGKMIRRLLVDYGEVISVPLPETTITSLAALADQPRATFLDRYWHHRPAYDLGQPATEYWSKVLDRDLTSEPRVAGHLTSVDVTGWLQLNPVTLHTLLGHARHTGTQLALLSNAPEPLAWAIDRARWSRHFDHRYYSCRLLPSPTHGHSSSC